MEFVHWPDEMNQLGTETLFESLEGKLAEGKRGAEQLAILDDLQLV